jgi:hypothetical protein
MKLSGILPLWDRSIVDRDTTTAKIIVGEPVRRETVFVADREWEYDLDYVNVLKDGDIYRMYFLTHLHSKDHCPKYDFTVEEISENKWLLYYTNTFICYAESTDGIHWERPSLGICEYKGSKDNNIIIRSEDIPEKQTMFDNFFVFKDTNKNCPDDERYKAVAFACGKLDEDVKSEFREGVSYYASSDGIHFRFVRILRIAEGTYDTLNTCSYDEKLGKYVMYYRGWHGIPNGGRRIEGIRDVKRATSSDFVNWEGFEQIQVGDDEPMYTNNVMPYYRNPDILIGFPTRYVERKVWTKNYDQLTGREARLERMSHGHPREGLAVTDCLFMSSRDGIKWDKYREAFFKPGMETRSNWVYGDCYPAYMMTETMSDDGENKEISMFMPHNYGKLNEEEPTPATLVRWTIRRDGFAYFYADADGADVVTKPFVFDAQEMYINFSTSAFGSIYITMTDTEGGTLTTCELFGDSDQRRVIFEEGEISDLIGKEVRLSFKMRDARLYSFELRKTNA